MVIIRLARSGAKKNPYYFVTVADERKPRDGSFIERLGFFNPSARGQEERLRVDLEKLDVWVSKVKSGEIILSGHVYQKQKKSLLCSPGAY